MILEDNQKIGDKHQTVTNKQNWDITKRWHYKYLLI